MQTAQATQPSQTDQAPQVAVPAGTAQAQQVPQPQQAPPTSSLNDAGFNFDQHPRLRFDIQQCFERMMQYNGNTRGSSNVRILFDAIQKGNLQSQARMPTEILNRIKAFAESTNLDRRTAFILYYAVGNATDVVIRNWREDEINRLRAQVEDLQNSLKWRKERISKIEYEMFKPQIRDVRPLLKERDARSCQCFKIF